MIGVYRFIQGGDVCEYKNLITTSGSQAILNYLAGISGSYAGGIVVGIDSTTPALSDKSLLFQVAQTPILLKSVNYANSGIIFKGSMDPSFAGKIYEVGVVSKEFSSVSSEYSNRLLASFTSSELWSNTGSSTFEPVTGQTRVGNDSIRDTVSTNGGTIVHEKTTDIDLSGYTGLDKFGIAFISWTDRVASINVKFTNSAGTEMSATQAVTHTAGDNNPQYNMYKINKSDFSNTASDWSSIVKISVTMTGSGTAGTSPNAVGAFDGLTVIDSDGISPDYTLISRSVGAPLVTKSFGSPLDIEYELRFNYD